MTLDREQKTYEKKLPELLAHAGKFVLIHDGEVADIFGTYEDAINAGVGAWPPSPGSSAAIPAGSPPPD